MTVFRSIPALSKSEAESEYRPFDGTSTRSHARAESCRVLFRISEDAACDRGSVHDAADGLFTNAACVSELTAGRASDIGAVAVGIEDVMAVKSLETGLVPPVPNLREPDPELGGLHLSEGGAYPVRYALRKQQAELSRQAALLAEAVKAAKGGQVEFRVEKAGIIHGGIGKASFPEADLRRNFDAFVDAIVKARPSGAKGKYVQRVALSSSMGPGLKVDVTEVASA